MDKMGSLFRISGLQCLFESSVSASLLNAWLALVSFLEKILFFKLFWTRNKSV